MTRDPHARKRISSARRLAQTEGRPFEVWEGDGQQPQRFTCPDHPGAELSIHELRHAPPDPGAWRYVVPHGTQLQPTALQVVEQALSALEGEATHAA